MSDIISAKCFGCGHVVKVPVALGGKKARCPKCTNTITIPAPTETGDDVVSDEELPEVAKDDEVLDGLPVEESEAPSEAAPQRETRPRPGSSSSHRRVQAGGRGAAQDRRGAPPRRGGGKKGSSTGLIIGIAVGVLAVIVIVAVAAGGKKPPPPKKAGSGQEETGTQPPPREKTAADLVLEEKVRDYITEFNRGNIAKAAQFFGERANEVRQAIGKLADEGAQYKNFNFKSSNAETGVVVITCEYVTKSGTDANREVTFTWKNADGTWILTGAP
jgi:hypothetical protein